MSRDMFAPTAELAEDRAQAPVVYQGAVDEMKDIKMQARKSEAAVVVGG